jgi:beta-glucosidase
MTESALTLPTGFVWGVATASYQIEGAVREDGRGESIWDRFSHTPGNVLGGDTGDVACNHYFDWKQDLAIMADLGVDAYRFSIAWPRVMPTGRGGVNEAGLDFYDRLVDGLLDAGITPFPTLYHWDLPQALEDEGGWTVRSTAEAFADYAGVVAGRLGDRIRHLATFNEPWCSAILGYETGEHAPGRRSKADALAAAHHLNVAHGLAVPVIRSQAPEVAVGTVLNFCPQHPASAEPADVDAALVAHDRFNRWFLGPIMGVGYPTRGVEATGWDMSEVLDGDLDMISAPIDFLGVNYYTRSVLSADGDARPAGVAVTSMDWEIYPDGLTEILTWITEEYPAIDLYVTENGAAFALGEDPAHDPERRDFLAAHLRAAHRAIEADVPLRGFFVWSLLDNFEWAKGYRDRFGIVGVDFATQRRYLRTSAEWYRDVIGGNGLGLR